MAETTVKVLLVEDDEDDYLLTRELLSEIVGTRFQLDWHSEFDPALAAMCANRYDVYLVDYRLGTRDGLELLNEAMKTGCSAPIILLTGEQDREIDLAATRAGAADFLVKSQINAPLLERSIRYSMQHARTLNELRQRDEQLRQAQKMEAIGRLAGGVAHDFNNLLTAITGYAELLSTALADRPELQNEVEEIRRAALRASSLTRQLLTFSRRQVLQIRVLDLNAVIREMQDMLRRLLGEAIEFSTSLAPDAPPVKADPGQMQQILLNLTVNARDAMDGEGVFSIDTLDCLIPAGGDVDHPGVPAGRYLVLRVSDNGIGMDAQTQSRIFEPFFTTKGEQGTGLGLSTVYAIVTGASGHLRVKSGPGEGTTFWLYWPATTEPLEPVDVPEAPQVRRNGNEVVLLVEDQELVRKLVNKVLEADGYQVLQASNGVEAMELCERHPGRIDLMVTDLVMPQMNGQELARRAVHLRPDMKVLFISGFAENEASDLGPDAQFLQKPFKPTELSRHIRRLLDTQKAAALSEIS
jgi:two-component system, cell cycle sensor histidine kinase and response regulator CckA